MESKHHSHDDHTECCHHHDKHDHCKCADHHHEHGPSCGCGHDHEHTLLPIQVTLAGVLFIVNSFVLDRFYGSDSMLSAMSALIGALIMGVPIVWTSIKDLFKGVLSINELVTLAVMAAFASGNYQTAGIVAFFMLLGEIIEMRTADGARKSIESLIKLAPTKARRLLKDGTEEEVPVSMLQIGDVVRVRPGDNVSADGVIVSGQGSFNQANITGESLPVDKKPGDEVFAGTQNLTGVLEIRVSRAGQDTTLGQVHNLILAAEKTRLPILRIIDQYM
ncbi:MAG: HAD-IC family P-type ATPase, partial [Verrucomicrobia bacterium]|nr:HAD-IC family P-type ATPase [Verrucomicrobiota bacterium]